MVTSSAGVEIAVIMKTDKGESKQNPFHVVTLVVLFIY